MSGAAVSGSSMTSFGKRGREDIFVSLRGVVALGHDTYLEIRQAIADFSEFNDDNDPHEEHDFGSLTVEGHHIFWKIDYYDSRQEFGSPDPTDPAVTSRLLTIMLASEY